MRLQITVTADSRSRLLELLAEVADAIEARETEGTDGDERGAYRFNLVEPEPPTVEEEIEP